jgi:hypothetical protein
MRGQLLPTSTREQVFGKINGEDAILRLSSNESNRREAPMKSFSTIAAVITLVAAVAPAHAEVK